MKLKDNIKSIQPQIDNFLREKDLRKISILTRQGYISSLTISLNHINKELNDITPDDIRDYVTIRQAKLNSKNIKRELRILNDFFEYCYEYNTLAKNPMPPRLIKKIRSSNEEKEKEQKYREEKNIDMTVCERILGSCKAHGNKMDTLILEIYINTGLRCRECKDLKASNLRYDAEKDYFYLSIIGKGNKHRNVPISIKLGEKIASYIKKTNKNRLDATIVDNYIFRDENGEQFTIQRWRERIDKYFTPGVTFHSFRHSLINRLLTAGVSIEVIEKIVGHSFPSTTKNYINLKPEQLWESVREAI